MLSICHKCKYIIYYFFLKVIGLDGSLLVIPVAVIISLRHVNM